jgi:hypothetical protein
MCNDEQEVTKVMTPAISLTSVLGLVQPASSAGTPFADAAVVARRAVAGGEHIVAQ